MQYTGQVVWFSLLTEDQREIIEAALNLAISKGAYSKSEELEANTMVEALGTVKEKSR